MNSQNCLSLITWSVTLGKYLLSLCVNDTNLLKDNIVLCWFFLPVVLIFNKRHKYGVSPQPVWEIKRKYQVEALIILLLYHTIYSKLFSTYKEATSLFPTENLVQNIWGYYEMNSIIIPECATYKYCSRILGCDLNPFTVFIITWLYFDFLTWVLFLYEGLGNVYSGIPYNVSQFRVVTHSISMFCSQ